MRCTLLFIFVAGLTSLQAAEEYTWWVDPCLPALAKSTSCEPDDTTLARWALEVWERESNHAITLKKSPAEEHARIRIHWASGADSLYGETQPAIVDGRRGANIYVLPNLNGLGPDIASAGRGDKLFRDAVVYLTCLHESGHALGLQHTRNFADIMYAFGYGGDIIEYFQRYRRQLKTRADIPAHSGLSDSDASTFRRTLR
ncbi:MAG TPA: hypothetical protein VG273_28500 [Bryobacteraceae bacterium]|nr:hypothetical protein [Bryobacteraceae bacterium]